MEPGKTSEFKIDEARICRAQGHSFGLPPHSKSSYYDLRRPEKYCVRCHKWIEPEIKKVIDSEFRR